MIAYGEFIGKAVESILLLLDVYIFSTNSNWMKIMLIPTVKIIFILDVYELCKEVKSAEAVRMV